MYLSEILKENKDEIIPKAVKTLAGANFQKYSLLDDDVNLERLNNLFDLCIEAVSKKDVTQFVAYVKHIANERYEKDYDFQEVNAAFNALEETIWSFILTNIEQENYREELGRVTSVLSAGKETLAAMYASLANKNKNITFSVSDLYCRE